MKKGKMSSLCRRGFAGFVALVMCMGLFQTAVFADDTEATSGGGVNISVVTVSNDNVSSKDAPQSDSGNTPAAEASGSTGNEADASSNTAEPKRPESSTPPAKASDDAEGSVSETTESKAPEENADQNAESETPEADTDQNAEQDEPESEALEEPKKDAPQQNGAFDLTQTERPGQSETVSVGTGTASDRPGNIAPESSKNWEIFYDKENDVYKLTFHIDSDAEGDQVIDMTYALELLEQYAQNWKGELEKAKAELEAKKEELREELRKTEDYQKYEAEYAEYEKAHSEDVAFAKQILKNFGNGYDINGKTDDELIAEYLHQFGDMFGELAKEPELPESIKEQMEEINKLKPPQDLKNKSEADVLEPGDIRKFMIFLSSSSNHTYKYQEGSFTLATPDFGLGKNPEDGTLGFDGQVMPDEYIDKAKYHVTLRSEPIRELLTAMGYDSYDVFNGPHGEDVRITKYLKDNYGGETVAESMNNYILKYYNTKDGTEYTSIDELVKNNPDAKAELTKTETSGNKWFTLNGEKFVVDVHLETEKFDRFYQALFSFAYGDKADIEKFLGEMEIASGGRFEYDNESWTNNGYQNALYYYMAHEEIWAATDAYFQKLLEGGLTAEKAVEFMMALNIDGELSGDDWQDTLWPWYNSIKLEQMDIDFSLTKTDAETGEAITKSETGFQVYYINKVKDDNGTVKDVKMYCSYDKETNSYTFVPTESTVWTKNGRLEINYAMMKDIVYYLQETIAPEGYERDTNVYILMDEEDYNAMSDEEKAALGEFDKFLETKKSEDGLKVSVEFTNTKSKNPPTTNNPDKPKKDPEAEVPEPEVPLADLPEEPLVDIPEEDVPLADTPEEVEIDDPDVPLARVPRTGDTPVFGYAAALFCICGLLLAKLRESSKNAK